MSNYVKLIPGLPTGTSIDERKHHGKQARKQLPRKDLGAWQPPTDRPRSTDLLLGQATTRIPELVPIRHARMAVSPFTFYRGAAIVMASDLGRSANSGLWAQLCGDAHLSNFGVFGTPERNLVFDVNDFDETNPGPFEWDLMRLVASFVLAARDNGLPDDQGRSIAAAAAAAYQQVLIAASQRSYLDNWYTMLTPDMIESAVRQGVAGPSAKQAERRVNKGVTKARSRDAWSAIRKLTEIGPDGRRRFLNEPPLLVRIENIDTAYHFDQAAFDKIAEDFVTTMEADRGALLSRYTLLDVAHKVVGVGSVGLPAVIGLFQGRDADDLLVLQFKAAEASVLEPWTVASPFEHHGQRVVVGQRIMQAVGDPFLGWITGPGGVDFYGRQLRDFKWSVDLNGLGPQQLAGYASLTGGTLALAHARAGDPVAFAAYVGRGRIFAEAMAQFAITYANLMEADYAEFTAAIADGEVEAAADETSATTITPRNRVASQA